MPRWERALAILRQHVPTGERVLDLGCGIGFTTSKVVRHYDTYGLDPSPDDLRRAQRRAPTAHLTVGSAEQLPYPDAYFAAVLLLDVLEHVTDERAVVAEVARVLRPSGVLVLSVPNAGLLRWIDSLNLYAWLTGENPLAPPGASQAGFTYHRHYSLAALAGLLGNRFQFACVHRSALGWSELVHLGVLLLAKRLLRSRLLYRTLLAAYLVAYLADDLLPLPRSGYHMMIAARRTDEA